MTNMDSGLGEPPADSWVTYNKGPHSCKAHTFGVLGFKQPVELPCVLIDGHDGNHRYVIEWSNPTGPSETPGPDRIPERDGPGTGLAGDAPNSG
jgi:hypothetical protein